MRLLVLYLFIAGIGTLYAQSQETTAPDEGDVIEVGESVIKVEIEKPQVQIIGKRIQPEFQNVNLEKSFINEILDKGQQIKFDYAYGNKPKRIDLKKILNRQR